MYSPRNRCCSASRRRFAVNVEGKLRPGVTAKDLILGIIGKIGVSGGTGHVFEYRGSTIRALSMDERMTVCNMSIEAGARAGMIAPDDTTFAYLRDKPRAPKGRDWDAALARWRNLASDPGAKFDASVDIDATEIEPMITYGTNPGMVVPIGGAIPDTTGDAGFDKALRLHGLSQRRKAMLGKPVNVVFIGSCTNGRLEDLQAAAQILKGRKVAPGVHLLIVPGSQQIKLKAEASGLGEIFRAAGADWRESGCSMCLGMNGDTVGAGQYSISTSNRNFEGRQGVGARTLLVSPLTAAASAVTGRITDPRETHVMQSVKRFRSKTVVIAVQQCRHRPDHPRAFSHHDHQGRLRAAIVRRLALSNRWRAECGFHPESARSPRRGNPGGRTQFWLRILARARALGAP